ncbi:TPA: hypothetical protein L5704_006054, partial [Pseudomonas aeruginosa]|nr:hypothetical protein [Pseudomonas aeruginosa]
MPPRRERLLPRLRATFTQRRNNVAKTWIYAASAAAIGGALIGGWLLDPA